MTVNFNATEIQREITCRDVLVTLIRILYARIIMWMNNLLATQSVMMDPVTYCNMKNKGNLKKS
jgi:hypothetical protein